MDRIKMAVTTALIIVICVLALIFIIPYACFLVNFWLGLIVTILFVLGISLRLFPSHLKKEGNKAGKEFRKAAMDNSNRLMGQIIKIKDGLNDKQA